jgi:adenine-specific DNA-methyltransferase
MKQNLNIWSKEELISRIEYLEDRYGLFWRDYPEKVDNNTFPMLEDIKDKFINSNGDNHLLIEGDNFHSLRSLLYTHKNKIDVIYIDPPYNTNNGEFIYHDKFSDKAKSINGEDPFRHSKWLSFIHKRIFLAHKLLSSEGVIFISIDENEFAQLKLLVDGVFGEDNFLENLIWIKNSTKNNSKTFSTNHEYILVYAKNKELVMKKFNGFKMEKPGLKEVMKIRDNFLKEEHHKFLSPEKELERRLKFFYSNNKELKGISHYKLVDSNFNVYQPDNLSAPGGGGPTYDILHPITKKPCKNSLGGWRYSESKMKELILQNKIHFGKDETNTPRYKRFLFDVQNDIFKSIITNSSDGSKELQEILGSKKFDYPKPISLIKELLSITTDKNSIVLDFFAGSGTTGQAVLELNREDNGNRQFILCTNNENNICQDVTYERLKSVINGYITSKDKNIEGIPGSLKYYKTKDVGNILNPTRKDIKEVILYLESLLHIKHTTFTKIKENKYYSIYENNNEITAYLKDVFSINDFILELDKLCDKKINFYFINQDPDSLKESINTLLNRFKNAEYYNVPDEIQDFFRRNLKGGKKS